MNFCISLSILVVVLGVLFQIGTLYFRTPFPVHPNGVILITGTSTGIGRHAAFELAKLNYTVFCTVRNLVDVDSLKEESKSIGKEEYIKPVIMDVTKKDQIESTLKEISTFITSTNQSFVALVNNAGISLRIPVEISPLDLSRQLFDINYFGALEVTQKFLPLIRKDKGRIIFISSLAGVASLVGNGIYASSKRAIEGLVDTLRLELIPFEVSVSSVLPGYIKTAISEKAIPKEKYTNEQTSIIYGKLIDELAEQRRKNFEGVPGPEVTSEVIVHSITSPYPLTRYYVGSAGDFPAQVIPVLCGIFSDRFLDSIKMATNAK